MPCHLVPRHLAPHYLVPCHLVPHHLVPRHLVPYHLVPHHLVLHHLVPHHLVPCLLEPPPWTLLPLLAQRWVPGRVTTWRYVGSTCQLGDVGSFMWTEGREGFGGPWEAHLLVGPSGNRWAHSGTMKPALVLLPLRSGGEAVVVTHIS